MTVALLLVSAAALACVVAFAVRRTLAARASAPRSNQALAVERRAELRRFAVRRRARAADVEGRAYRESPGG